MQTMFNRSPWERSSVVPLRGPQLGQYGDIQNGGGMYSWNTYGMNPEQRLLQNAQESMNTPPPLTVEQRLLQQNAQVAAGECYTCANGGDIKTGVDAATAASLKAQGYRCRKDECAQKGYGAGSYSGFNGFGNQMTYGSQQSSIINSQNTDVPAYGGGTAMMMGRRYPVVNSR